MELAKYEGDLSLDVVALGMSLGAAVLWAIKIREPPSLIRFIAKVLSVSLLSITVVLRGGPRLLVAALAFGSLGDASLVSGNSDKSFLGALLSFLIGHALYIILFSRMGGDSAALWANTTRSVCAVTIVVNGAAIIFILLPRVKSRLRLPILIYCVVLATMSIKALSTASNGVAAGGFIFCVSDTLLAVNKFVIKSTSPSRVWIEHLIAVLYYSAQAMITLGALNT